MNDMISHTPFLPSPDTDTWNNVYGFVGPLIPPRFRPSPFSAFCFWQATTTTSPPEFWNPSLFSLLHTYSPQMFLLQQVCLHIPYFYLNKLRLLQRALRSLPTLPLSCKHPKVYDHCLCSLLFLQSLPALSTLQLWPPLLVLFSSPSLL